MNTYRIQIEGLVQGVGFRPFIYRLANTLKLYGTVENRNNGVSIYVNTSREGLDNLISLIKSKAPQHSKIESISSEKTEDILFTQFSIITSGNVSEDITGIGPDIAVCKDCLDDMKCQEHRLDYPLINCTNCGPRFSIIKGVPYDRSITTMNVFEMCDKCRKEYEDISDRRFHAQPVACNNCGPKYSLHLFSDVTGGDGSFANHSFLRPPKQSEGACEGEKVSRRDVTKERYDNIYEIVTIVTKLIEEGSVVAVKGTGGYHLLCDANNENTVKTLRIAKSREGKPFAVMCRDISAIRKIARLSDKDIRLITSWRRPVILLQSKDRLAPSVSNGLNTVGVVLPYMPFHYLLFRELKINTIVFTSANLYDEPVIISDDRALAELNKLAGGVVMYNREIYNRTDDSVCRAINGNEMIIRRSRGYSPSPVNLSLKTEGIFGAGAELTNCFALGKGNQVILSQHIGDLKNAETLDFYTTSYQRFSEMFRFTPSVVVKDLHPDYLSSSFADKIASELNIKVEQVQHHHAHVAACMAENGLDEKVIGIALDGIGLGTDGKIWGGEFMIADLCDFERIKHFEYVAIAGGDKVSPEPWRSGISYLYKYSGEQMKDLKNLKIKEVGKRNIEMYKRLLEKNINTSLFSGAGRLFDAVAAITGVCLYSSYHAEAPMLLESVIMPGIPRSYDFEINGEDISFRKTIRGILSDLENDKTAGEISAVFHNTVIRSVVDTVNMISMESGIRKVVLSGGTFQNKYLAENIINELSGEKYFVYFHNQVPPNDGGLALGQVAIAAARLSAQHD
jgi:hydrogenase maturation protein HypF